VGQVERLGGTRDVLTLCDSDKDATLFEGQDRHHLMMLTRGQTAHRSCVDQFHRCSVLELADGGRHPGRNNCIISLRSRTG
jgi:hypothetical protein